MADKPTLGLTLHSHFARQYAAQRRENPIAHAERTMAHVEMAMAIQQAHAAALEEHMASRNGGMY